MSSTTTESMRYQKLVEIIDKALQESRKAFDMNVAIQECYGADAAIFGAATLAKLLESLMDRVNDSAKQQVLESMEKDGVQAKLQHVEDIIAALEQQAAEKSLSESVDRETATNALAKAKLPDGILPDDVVSHRAYVIMKKECEGLEQEISAMEEETKRMQEQIAQAEASVKKRLGQVEETGTKLERTADACSFVS